MTFIADRLKRIKPSMTVGINVKANALRAEGKDVLVLAAGEPDFDTPHNIRKAASDAMDAGKTRYVPGKGTPELQKAIQSKFLKDNLEFQCHLMKVQVKQHHHRLQIKHNFFYPHNQLLKTFYLHPLLLLSCVYLLL